MQEFVNKLQTLLNKLELTPLDARDGVIAAYVVIAGLNQSQGNSAAGLKQEPTKLFSHIQGFMGAIFWERGFDFEHPTLDQLVETKIMMDGMTQIYAMPAELQDALNEVYDYLLKRARRLGGVLSPETRSLLKLDDFSSPLLDSSDFAEPAGEKQKPLDDVQKILEELPSEMESAWKAEMATLQNQAPATETPAVTPGGKTLEQDYPFFRTDFDTTQESESMAPEITPERETAQAAPGPDSGYFDPSKVLEDEAPMPGSPMETEFDPAKILEDEAPVRVESPAEVLPEPEFNPAAVLEDEAPVMAERPAAEVAPEPEFNPAAVLEDEAPVMAERPATEVTPEPEFNPAAVLEDEAPVMVERPAAEVTPEPEFPATILEDEAPALAPSRSEAEEITPAPGLETKAALPADQLPAEGIAEPQAGESLAGGEAPVAWEPEPALETTRVSEDSIPQADEFDLSQTLEQEAPDTAAADFDLSKMLDEKTPGPQPEPPQLSEKISAAAGADAQEGNATWEYEVLTGEKPAPEPEAAAGEKPKRRKKTKTAKPAKTKKSGEDAKPKKRGRKKKVVTGDEPPKPKRTRNIKPKAVKIDLSSITVPDDYMVNFGGKDATSAEPAAEQPSEPAAAELDRLPEETAAFDLPETLRTPEPEAGTAPQEALVWPAAEEPANFQEPAFAQELPPAEPASETTLDLGAIAEQWPDMAPAARPQEDEDYNPEAHEATPAKLEEPDWYRTEMDQPEAVASAESVELEKEPEETISTEAVEPAVIPYRETAETDHSQSMEDTSWADRDTARELSFADRLEQEPAPTSSPSSWTELNPEPAGGEPMRQDELPEPDAGYETQEETMDTGQPQDELPPRRQGGFMKTMMALLLGLALGGGACYYWFGVQQTKKIENQLAEAKKGKESAEAELAKVREEAKKFGDTIQQQIAASEKPLAKLQYLKVGKGVLIYWNDASPVKRSYYVYSAKGSDEPEKASGQPMHENLLLIKQAPAGTWKYSVAAVDVNGKETGQSETLTLKFPLK